MSKKTKASPKPIVELTDDDKAKLLFTLAESKGVAPYMLSPSFNKKEYGEESSIYEETASSVGLSLKGLPPHIYGLAGSMVTERNESFRGKVKEFNSLLGGRGYFLISGDSELGKIPLPPKPEQKPIIETEEDEEETDEEGNTPVKSPRKVKTEAKPVKVIRPPSEKKEVKEQGVGRGKAKGSGAIKYNILGRSATSILRFAGKDGWSDEQAQQLLDHYKIELSPATFKTQLHWGRTGYKEAPTLTEDEVKELYKIFSE